MLLLLFACCSGTGVRAVVCVLHPVDCQADLTHQSPHGPSSYTEVFSSSFILTSSSFHLTQPARDLTTSQSVALSVSASSSHRLYLTHFFSEANLGPHSWPPYFPSTLILITRVHAHSILSLIVKSEGPLLLAD